MSELHNRLSHLVNYSSQLIFVSGDSASDNQRTLNEFLSKQQENTEVSYFGATAGKAETDYRSMICRQLGGHTVGSFVRPLNQLLIDLVAENGPYLICITQAERLSDAFLQELWDWVMHAQQYNHHLHLNVILFGTPQWAQASQDWLPSENSHKPVLLSSERIDAVGFDVNALEALMAQDNSWFDPQSPPIVTNKWFISSVLGVFFLVFLGLISWQYPQHIGAFFEGELSNEGELPAFNIDESSINKSPLVPNFNTSISSDYRQEIEVLNEIETEPEAQTTPSIPSVTETLLVTNWSQSASEPTIKSQSTNTTKAQQDTIVTSSEPPPQNESNETAKTALVEQTDTQPIRAAEFDFAVPDIISIEQLDAQLNQLPNAISNEVATSTRDNSPQENIAQTTPANANEIAQTSQSAIDYRFDETTLLSLPTDSIVLQLSGIQNPVVLADYLNSNNLKANTWVYETQRYGGPWFVVLYKQSFDSIDAALSRLPSLPDDITDAQPFAKSIDQIQREIRSR